MANAATKSAPSSELKFFEGVLGQKVKEGSLEHQYLEEIDNYEISKNYVFELASENNERENGVYEVIQNRNYPVKTNKHNASTNLVLSSQIVWNGGRVGIRYYDGCDTIFVADQPKDKDIIDQFIKQTNRRYFLHGKLGMFGDEKMLLFFCKICSWNVESPFRTRSASNVFKPVDRGMILSKESSKLDQIEEALALAKSATENKMLIHGNYLGISNLDFDGNEVTPKDFRIEYRKKASEDPGLFIESYGNKVIELKYYIDQALLKGLISNKANKNRATWGKNNAEICDISGLTSHDAISDRLLEYAQTEEGTEFGIQLKTLFSS